MQCIMSIGLVLLPLCHAVLQIRVHELASPEAMQQFKPSSTLSAATLQIRFRELAFPEAMQ